MVRIAKIQDSPRMAEIKVFGWRCAYKHFIPLKYLFNELTVKNSEMKFIEILSIENNPGKTYVFEEDNIIKAYMTIGNTKDEDKDNRTFELWVIYVDPLFQRQNIGEKLVDFCIDEAKNKCKEEIVLWVFKKNENSIKFYEKMGFTADGKTKMHERLKEKEIRMLRKLGKKLM